MVESNVKETIKNYRYNTLLTLIIFILFLVFGYSSSNTEYELYIKDLKIWLDNEIYVENGEQYIHIEDLTNIFEDNVYHDKISGKLILTTYNKLVKVNTNDDGLVKKVEGAKYVKLEKIMGELGYDTIVSNNKIYLLENEYVDGNILKNKVEVFEKESGNVLCFVNKGMSVKIYADKNVQQKAQIVSAQVSKDGKEYYGYILKQNVQFEYEKIHEEETLKKQILVKADEKLASNTDIKYVDMVAINMFRLSGADVLTKLEYANNVPKEVDVYATINNGQKSSNYDSDITTAMLNSESNRTMVIEQIVKNIDNLAGVNLDFANFKVADKENYTQFVKELAAVLHSNNKKIIVNITSTQYIDVERITRVVDYIVVQPYSARTLASKISGPTSAISYVKQQMEDILGKAKNTNKVILEVPAYTILWTERRGTVINAEQYNMKMMQEYLEENKKQSSLDSVSGQNYINYTKGITTYKMWLEDEYSINEKAKLVKQYDLAGLSIYKSGMELNSIYSKIFKTIDK